MKATSTQRLGTSTVEVTRLGLGGAALGNLYAPVTDETARATVERARALGVGLFDTAPYYGYGLSEERLGAVLSGIDRDSFVFSTKVGRRLVPRPGGPRSDQGFVDARPFDPVFDYSYDGVLRSHEASLARLGTDRVDILLLHDLGRMTHGEQHPELFRVAIEGGLRAMRTLRESGTVGAIGLGVNEAAVCLDVLEHTDLDCLLLAGRYTLLEQAPLDALLPLCVERQVSVIVGGPFNSGVLVEPEGDGEIDAHFDYARAPREVLERVARIRRVCDDFGVPLPAAALQLPLHHPAVACVIPGARAPAEVEAQQHWLECEVPIALYRALQQEGLLRRDTPIGAPT